MADSDDDSVPGLVDSDEGGDSDAPGLETASDSGESSDGGGGKRKSKAKEAKTKAQAPLKPGAHAERIWRWQAAAEVDAPREGPTLIATATARDLGAAGREASQRRVSRALRAASGRGVAARR
jgi:hypothetical protein